MSQGLIGHRLWKPGRMTSTPEEHAIRAEMLIRDGVEFNEAIEQAMEIYMKSAFIANEAIEKMIKNARDS